MPAYRVRMWCEGGASEYTTVEADTLQAAERAALEAAEEWTEDGEWGCEGAAIDCGYQIFGEGDDVLAEGSGTVSIKPNHEAMIKAALRGSYRIEDCCGTTPDDHDWTSEGEGGCRENPGVWSHGGTTISSASHCRKCGLHRVEMLYGSQRNPGQVDTTEYSYPEEWQSDSE